ncbi:MAG: hypothetical protein JXN65_08115 [Clostridia bacterium]|nr:hypothetical protein [Clostridia bacterium]
MTKYVKAHTQYILNQLKAGNITEDILGYHRLQIANIQHERLIHLIVLFIFALLLIASVVLFFYIESIETLLLTALFLVVEAFYVAHYYLLENTVQRWYKIENFMISKLKNIGTNIEKF